MDQEKPEFRRAEETQGSKPEGATAPEPLNIPKAKEPLDLKTVTEIVNAKVGKAFAAIKDLEAKLKDVEQVSALQARASGVERVWSRAYINDLPDSAFAYIAPGGEKDESGRTVSRSLRYLPFKDASGKVDLPHLRNALARLPQTRISAEGKAEAKRILCAAAKEVGLSSAVCGTEECLTPPMEEWTISAAVEELGDRMEALEAQIQGAEKQVPIQERALIDTTSYGKGIVEPSAVGEVPEELRSEWERREREAQKYRVKRYEVAA